MNETNDVSRELRNAFADGELDPRDWERVAERLQADPALRDEVCELRSLKDLVRAAYAAPPLPRPRVAERGRRWGALAAACVIGTAIGWTGHSSLEPAAPGAEITLSDGASLKAVAEDRILVHVSSSRRETLSTALEEIEDVLRAAQARGRLIQVELVANSSGLDLLRRDVTPFEQRIVALLAQHPNVSLIACNQTIERLREKGSRVQLLPGVDVAPSALDQVVKRLRGGWAYVRA